MNYLISLVLGYLMGTLSPAALFARRKQVDLTKTGTGNLGASNALQMLGRGYGLAVMVLDITKAYLAARAARWLFPKLALAGMLAAAGAVAGHIFPFYRNFQGGKGLAAFGGLVCFYDPKLFVFYLLFGIVLMLIVNYSWVMPMYAAATFPMAVALQTGDLGMTALAALASSLVAAAHWENIGRAVRGEDTPIREILRTKLLKR